jgi:CheY-like chemotaxis protein
MNEKKNFKILIIDDDELIRLTIGKVLKKLGYIVLEAENGNAGLVIYKKEQPDLVITDMLMPDKEGLETISDLRAINPKIKIIAMSGGGSTHNMAFLQLAQKLGANASMGKPIKPDELLNTVKSLLDV